MVARTVTQRFQHKIEAEIYLPRKMTTDRWKEGTFVTVWNRPLPQEEFRHTSHREGDLNIEGGKIMTQEVVTFEE